MNRRAFPPRPAAITAAVAVAAAVATSAALAAPAKAAPAVRAVTWSPQLAGPTLADLRAALSKPWDEAFDLRLAHTREHRKVDTCSALATTPKGFAPKAGADRLALRRARCHVIARLLEAAPAPIDFVGPLPLDLTLLDQLPATLIPAASDDETEELKQAAARGVSWHGKEPTLAVDETRGDDLLVSSDETRASVTILGRGDFNGDGLRDVIVERAGGGNGGTWVIREIFVLSRRSAGSKGPLEVVGRIE
jgi:hypothetical protein